MSRPAGLCKLYTRVILEGVTGDEALAEVPCVDEPSIYASSLRSHVHMQC
jgi:hypothetical protein